MKFACFTSTSKCLLTASMAAFLMLPGRAGAQAKLTANKTAEITVFGGYLASTSDYGSFIKEGIGGGIDFTVFPAQLPFAPSIEVRIQDAFGTEVTEKALLYGIRLQRDIRRFHPYVDGLFGASTVTFHPKPAPDYTANSTRTFAYGGGLNLSVTDTLAAKFDIQRESWNLGGNAPRPAGGVYTLQPTAFLVGVTYTIPFKDRH